jgi:23S rRNA (guanosine2251-2'-O)-methyltransferase
MEKRKYVKYNRPKENVRNEEDMIFGTRAVIETIKSGKQIEKIFVQKGLNNELFSELNELIRSHRLSVSKVPVEKLNRLTRKNHQGVIAYVSPITYVPLHNVVASSYENGRTPLILILDRITDVRNFGAICRTAECTGVNAVVVPAKGGALINSDAVKTSAGALNYLSICKEDNLLNTVTYLKESGFQVIACTEKTDKLIYEAEYNIPTAVIMGSEENGISDELIEAADLAAKIPLNGEIASLNVSVASAVVLYECLRQRM